MESVLDLGVLPGRNGGRKIVKCAQVDPSIIYRNTSLPSALCLIPDNASYAAGVASIPFQVLCVLSRGNIAKIVWAVVGPDTVLVVNLANWPVTMVKCEGDAVGADYSTKEIANSISLTLVANSLLPSVAAIPSVASPFWRLTTFASKHVRGAREPIEASGSGVQANEPTQKVN